MDILKDFKEFILGEGLKDLIFKFRNPSWEETAYFEAEYLPETDSRRMVYDQDEPWEEEGSVTISFTTRLNAICSQQKKELYDRLENILALKNNNSDYIQEIIRNSDTDFNDIRKQVKENPDINPYSEILMIYILDIETIYLKFRNTITQNYLENKVLHLTKNQPQKNISFKFKGNNRELKSIYHFILDSGDFIDKQKTTEKEFIEILTANDVLKTKGIIHFGCETRQMAYILSKMVGIFDNLKFSVIESSEKFKSKKGTVVKANNIQKALSDKTPVKEKKRIDTFFKTLTEKQ